MTTKPSERPAEQERPQGGEGITFERRETRPGRDPFDGVEWESRTAGIETTDRKAVFEQRDVTFPKAWSQHATNIVVSRYFRGKIGSPGREQSARHLIGRVVRTIDQWAEQDRYFRTRGDREAFRDELTQLILHQRGSFNSPVWFNCGFEEHPQCSACFINSVEDTMESILDLAKTEGMLFKWGSGTGTNISPLRSSREHLQGGGTASGPISFMRGYDAFAGVIKSGGKNRRAAKMVILNVEHPDVMEFDLPAVGLPLLPQPGRHRRRPDAAARRCSASRPTVRSIAQRSRKLLILCALQYWTPTDHSSPDRTAPATRKARISARTRPACGFRIPRRATQPASSGRRWRGFP